MKQISKSYLFLIFIFGLFSCFLLSKAKEYVSPQKLQEDSFLLARVIYESDFRPTYLIALWRGGSPIGIAIEEYFRYKGEPIRNHTAVRVSAYKGSEQKQNVQVYNLEAITKEIKSDDRLLIVDDIVDSGNSVSELLKDIREQCGENAPKEIKIATIYHKPKFASIMPDYYLYETDKWVVFPHELEELSVGEIREHKGLKISNILK